MAVGKWPPVKNAAVRVTFPILDADGDLVTGATSPDSERSIDSGTFADCSNEAVEIATSSGMYYLDLNASEMNGDTIALIIKSGNGKTTPMVFYPVSGSFNDIYSDTTIIASDLVIVGSDLIIAASDIVQIYSDTTIIASDLVIAASDIVQIYSDTTIIHSDTVVISSDTAAIEAAGGALSAAQDSKLTVIHSDSIVIESDTTAIEGAGDSKVRITSTVDESGNRSSVTVDETG